jgi:protein involved in temperature-dependent protein secretion
VAELRPILERARAAERDGRLDDALAAYREAVGADPKAGEPRIRIVGILMLRGQNADAEREAQAFVDAAGTGEAFATLGQVQRLSGYPDAAISTCARAAALNPALRPFLNDARRARYWKPDGDAFAALYAKNENGEATPAERYRLLHLRFLGLLNPDAQRWLTTLSPDQETLSDPMIADLDKRFGGRYTSELAGVTKLAEDLRVAGPLSPARARVVTASGAIDGTIVDTDSTILGALEVIENDAYALVPFSELKHLEVVSRASWFHVRLTRRDGRESEADVPALYYHTEWCRDPQLRDGHLTVWKAFTPRFRVGLGLRDFVVGEGKLRLLGIDAIKAVEFA